jgi:hypothetical protein
MKVKSRVATPATDEEEPRKKKKKKKKKDKGKKDDPASPGSQGYGFEGRAVKF